MEPLRDITIPSCVINKDIPKLTKNKGKVKAKCFQRGACCIDTYCLPL